MWLRRATIFGDLMSAHLGCGRVRMADLTPVFALSVDKVMAGAAPPLPVIPPIESPNGGTALPRATLMRGAIGELVKVVQKKLGVTVDGDFGAITEAAVREFQRQANVTPKLGPDGRVGPNTWRALDTV
jgi:peptidoglycan hydrolase-like protein with peptidoglycan-binding domain